MTWIQTFSGRAVDLLSPTPDQIDLADIAHSLARIRRYAGHTSGEDGLTLAQHSLLVRAAAVHAAPLAYNTHLWALLHDAHEAYTGDLTSPLQLALEARCPGFRSALKDVQWRFDRLIGAKFGLTEADIDAAAPIVSRCDLIALATERQFLLGKGEREWPAVELPPPLPMNALIVLPAPQAQKAWLRVLRHTLARCRSGPNGDGALRQGRVPRDEWAVAAGAACCD
jgi:hypothetical protein